MCGIAGALFWNRPSEVDPKAVVSLMVDALAHRGPDGRGVLVGTTASGATIAFGHTRLAILDLSDRGAQPMSSADGRVSITFNGEIYNFHSLRRELERAGRRFQTGTDTEVLLEGYEEWGSGVVDRARGMFALAIWDRQKNVVLIARDRFGIKPVYVYRDRGSLLFASEIRALFASGLVPRRLDLGSVESYLTYQTVPPPRTLVAGVEMLAPGHALEMDLNTREVNDHQYWDLLDDASAEAASATSDEARRRVREILIEATALHLVSDVPVGVFLSGGIDSSALVALTREAGTTPHTFSVTLPGSVHDEAPYARAIAERFGAEHCEIPLTDHDFRDGLPGALSSVDHPSGDGLNTFVVSRAVRATGLKVALSGLGGDEIFGGYPSFGRMRRLAAIAPAWRHSPQVVRNAAAAAVRVVGRDSIESVKAAAVLEGDGGVPQAFPVLRQLFGAAERAELLAHRPLGSAHDDPYVSMLEAASRRHPDASVMSLVSFAEARSYMHDVLLRDTDQMSMAHALEVRVPLLDHELAEYVMGLPEAVKEPGDVPKRLLVESLGDALPGSIVHRPKQGFVLPFDTWMKGELRDLCEHHLGPDGLSGRSVCEPAAVQKLWARFLAGDRRTTWSRPWALVALNAWLERCGIRD